VCENDHIGRQDVEWQGLPLVDDLHKLEQSAKGTFWELLGCEIEEITDTRVILSINAELKHMNGLRILHGGVTASLLDNVMALAGMAVFPNRTLVTTNINIHFVSALKEGKIFAIGEVLHCSKNSFTAQGKIVDDKGEIGAIGTGAFRIIG
jgi:uncharacterized protein (TIGR00369 family)